MRILLVLAGLLLSTVAFGEQSTDSTGDYAMDLGQVYGAVQALKFMKEICSEAFPAQSQSNELAYAKWRSRFLPFLQEVEKHWSAAAWREAKGDPKQHVDFLNKIANYFDQYKEGLRKQMSSDGLQPFQKQCGLYPTYLTTDRTNLEYFYAEQVTTLRKGPEKM